MELTIRKIDQRESPQTKSFSRKCKVNSRLVPGIESDKLVFDL
jgi:hypothetical protein